MTDVARLGHDQLVRIALAARTLVRSSRDGPKPGDRLHRGEDEWALLACLSGELPATEEQKRKGRRTRAVPRD